MSITSIEKRFPDWKNVFVAILEKQIETVIGENAIDEIKQPYLRKELNEKLGSIYDAVEKQFIEQINDDEIRAAVLGMPLASLPLLQHAFGEFFRQPQSNKLKIALKKQLKMDYPHLPENKIDSAVHLYTKILHDELTPLSEFQRMSLVYSVSQISDHAKQLDAITLLLTELVAHVKNNSASVLVPKKANDDLFVNGTTAQPIDIPKSRLSTSLTFSTQVNSINRYSYKSRSAGSSGSILPSNSYELDSEAY